MPADSFDAGAVALVPQLGDAPVRASPDRNDPAGWRDLEALFEDFASAKNAKRTSMDMFDFLSAAPEMVPGGVDVDVDALVPTLSDGVVPSVPRASIDSTMPKATRTSLDSILGGNDDLLVSERVLPPWRPVACARALDGVPTRCRRSAPQFGMVSGDKLRVPAFIDPNASQASQADLMVPEAVVPAPAPAESPVPAVRAVPSWDAAPQEEEEEEERDVDVEDADFAPHVPAPELVLCTVPFAERMRDPEARRQRLVAIERYRSKRQRRQFKKTIRYQSRKAYAEVRPRIKGRFATKVRRRADPGALCYNAGARTASLRALVCCGMTNLTMGPSARRRRWSR